jgi:hypothetical protein
LGAPQRGLPPVTEPSQSSTDDPWEERLRRWAGEERESTASPPVLASPPIQQTAGAPVERADWSTTHERTPPPMVEPIEERVSEAGSRAAEWIRHARSSVTPTVTSVSEAYLRNAQGHAHALFAREGRPRTSPVTGRQPATRTGRAAVTAMFRNPDTVRDAVIAATILHPPRGLE